MPVRAALESMLKEMRESDRPGHYLAGPAEGAASVFLTARGSVKVLTASHTRMATFDTTTPCFQGLHLEALKDG